MKYLAVLCFFIVLISSAQGATNENARTVPADDDYFDPALFRGGKFSAVSLTRLTKKNTILPGQYKMDLYINGRFAEQLNVDFTEQADGAVKPCIKPEMLAVIGLKQFDELKNEKGTCPLIEQLAKGSSATLDVSRLRLDFNIPQVLLNKIPRGYVNPAELNTGASLGFANYVANYYHVSYSGNDIDDRESAWLSLNGGINLGSWQYRQLSTLNWDKVNGSAWNNIRSYVQRPLPSLQSQLTMGELITNGRFFSGLNFNGVSLATDDRMLPDSMRGYAPTIRGIAATNAKVSVTQNGAEIYQTTVMPGSFEINDL